MNFFKNFFPMILIFSSLAGCIDDQTIVEKEKIKEVLSGKMFGPNRQGAYDNMLIDNVIYGKDKRTGLCYAFIWAGGYNGGPGFTNVPCTPEVLKLISD